MDKVMLTGILIQTIVLTAVCVGTYALGCKWHVNDWTGGHDPADQSVYHYTESIQSARTMTCLLIVFAELLRAYTSRTLRVSIFQVGVFSNKYMQYSVGASVFGTLLISHEPHLMEIFSLNYLSKLEWAVVMIGSLIPVTVDELTKLVYRRTGFGIRPPINYELQQAERYSQLSKYSPNFKDHVDENQRLLQAILVDSAKSNSPDLSSSLPSSLASTITNSISNTLSSSSSLSNFRNSISDDNSSGKKHE